MLTQGLSSVPAPWVVFSQDGVVICRAESSSSTKGVLTSCPAEFVVSLGKLTSGCRVVPGRAFVHCRGNCAVPSAPTVAETV